MPGRAEDLEAVVSGGLQYRRHVGRRGRRGRDLRDGSGGPERADEALEAGRLRDQQEASLVGADDERVRHVAWAEHEGTCRRDERLARDPDGELALKDVEPLVLLMVDVQRRAGAARRGLLGQHHAAAGSRAIGLDRRQAAEEPEVLSLTGTESDGCKGAVRRGRGVLLR